MSDSELSLGPPASVATKLEISADTSFIAYYNRVGPEAIARSVTLSPVFVFIGTTRVE